MVWRRISLRRVHRPLSRCSSSRRRARSGADARRAACICKTYLVLYIQGCDKPSHKHSFPIHALLFSVINRNFALEACYTNCCVYYVAMYTNTVSAAGASCRTGSQRGCGAKHLLDRIMSRMFSKAAYRSVLRSLAVRFAENI